MLSATVLLGLPIIALNAWIYVKGTGKTFWSSPFREGIIVLGILVVFSFVKTLKANWSGFFVSLGLTVFIVVANLYMLTLTKNYALAFYALFVIIVSILHHIALFKTFQAPYYNPGLSWFEGVPRFIPRLEGTAIFADPSKMVSLRLTQLTDEGCFAYASQPEDLSGDWDEFSSIKLNLGDNIVSSQVEIITELDRSAGLGLRFVRGNGAGQGSFDSDKEMKDFINTVRSAGYVS